MSTTGQRIFWVIVITVAILILVPFIFPGFTGGIIGDIILAPIRWFNALLRGIFGVFFG